MLTIRNLQTGYGKVQILRGVDMSVRAGRIVALLGGNGTGKSTLLKAVSGLLPVWSGSIEFNGEEIQNHKPHVIVRRGLTQVTQGKDMYPAMTVEENLRIGAYTAATRPRSWPTWTRCTTTSRCLANAAGSSPRP